MKKYLVIGGASLAAGYMAGGYLPAWVVPALIVVAALGFMTYFLIDRLLELFLKSEAVRQARHKTKLAEAKAHKERFFDSSRWGLFYQEKDGVHKALHLTQNVYSNGHYIEPTQAEIDSWKAIHTKQGYAGLPDSVNPNTRGLLLESGETGAHLDIDVGMCHLGMAYAVIGEQQCGKTYNVDELICKTWLSRNVVPTVIALKSDTQEWDGCQLVGGTGEIATIIEGINAVSQEATRRHQSKMGHKDHPPLIIILDDWDDIVLEAPRMASRFVQKALTMYASVNIVCYFLLHDDTLPAWGLTGVGASVKNKVVKLVINKGMQADGSPNPKNSTAQIQYPSGEIRPTSLVGQYHQPEVLERKVVELNRQGFKPTQIAEATIGKGGNQVARIKRILDQN